MEPPAAAPRPQPVSSHLAERVGPLGAWLFGFLLVALTAGHDGGFFPSAWAWTAFATWLLTACVISLRPRSALGALDLAMAGGALAFCGWFALSALWSQSVPSTLDESFRYLAYAGLVAAALVVVERRTVPRLLGGVTAAIALLSLYALGTRLLPDRLGAFEPILGYRLTGTIGYWNGLGIFAVMGLLLALGFAARAERPATRALAGAALPVLAMTMYFTFSRGAWLALLVGFAAAFAVDPRRLQLVFAGAVLGVLARGRRPARLEGRRADAAGGVVRRRRARRPPARSGARPSRRLSRGGRRRCSGGSSGASACPPRSVSRGRRCSSSCFSPASAAVSAAGGIAGPLAQRAWDRAQAAPQATANNGRLFDLSSNGRLELWRAAWDTLLGASGRRGRRRHLLAGLGAEPARRVHLHRGAQRVRRDAGRAGDDRARRCCSSCSCRRFVGAVRARRSPLVPFALAAFAGWVVHAGIDLDWELTGVTGAALLCGVALVAAGRRGAPRALRSGRARRRACARRAADGGRRDERALEPAARLGPGRAAAGRPRPGGGGRPQLEAVRPVVDTRRSR